MEYKHDFSINDRAKLLGYRANKLTNKQFIEYVNDFYEVFKIKKIFAFIICEIHDITYMTHEFRNMKSQSNDLLSYIYESEICPYSYMPIPEHENANERYAKVLPITAFANALSQDKKEIFSDHILKKENILENIMFVSAVKDLPFSQRIKHKDLILKRGNTAENVLYCLFNDACLYEHFDKIYNGKDFEFEKKCRQLIEGYYGVTETFLQEYAQQGVPVRKLKNFDNQDAVRAQLEERHKIYLREKTRNKDLENFIDKHF